MRTTTFAAVIYILVGAQVDGASLTGDVTNDVTNYSQTLAVYLVGGPQNGTFNTVIFKSVPAGSAQFLNPTSGAVAGVPRPPGQAFTYANRLLNADPLDFPGGQNWSVLGLTFTAAELSYSGGPLGGNISTADQPGGRLFLANLHLPPAGQATTTVTLVNSAGAQVGPTLSIIFVPEPASFGLVSTGVLGLAAIRRRHLLLSGLQTPVSA